MHNTSQIATIIGAVGLVATMLIVSVALGVVIVHDGNTAEVNTAMQIVGAIAQTMGIGVVVLAGASGAVSAFVSRFQNSTPLQSPSEQTPPQPQP